ncbi:carabin isoform X3 [Labeo rohita]|uniref:Carabin isoform X3 n=1 Tax=Labeo rohita TaxID=84645 RepID=A0A498M218_LABRO|nr:carabin isoform X3 [Labeo rohita]
MSGNPDHSKDEEENHGLEVTVVETNRFGFILGNGETDSDGPCPELVRHRESKWLSLMTQWEQVVEKKSNKVKGQCQKGIPASLRAKGWPLLCGAKDRKEKNQELKTYEVAVVLVRRCLGDGRLRKECDGQMETLERLRGVKQRVQHEQADAFIHEVCSVSLSLADLQKQTEKELEKWKKDKPNSTFDPRGRCHGYRMVWERAQDKPKEQEKKERPKGSLTLPLMRSHSSLSPSLLHKKWRKRSSKTDTEEWDGGGRKFSRSLMEESDDEEVRRRSVCGIVGEQRAKRDRLADEFCAHKDHNTHPEISVVVSSSMDCDVFEKEPTETLNQQKETETARSHEEERTADVVVFVVEDSIQTHHHMQNTNQDAQSTDAPTNQNEQNTDKQTCRDEQIVEEETEGTSEACEESTPAETSQEDNIQTDSSKQEEEIQSDSNIQEHCKQEEQTEERLPSTIITGENTIETVVQIHVVLEEEGSQTSSDEEPVHSESQRDLFVSTAIEKNEETELIGENHTDADKEEGIHLDVLPEETTEISDPSGLCEEKDDKILEDDRQDISLDESDSHGHSSGKETLPPPEIVLTSSSLKTEQESETEHPDIPADPKQEFQEQSDTDATVTSTELEHCPVESTVGDAEGSGNPEQSEVDSADGTIITAPQEVDATVILTQDAETCCDKEISEINPINSEFENIVCCEVSATDKSHSVEDDTCRSAHTESNEMENPECNTIDITVKSGKLESSGVEIAGSGNPESNEVPVTSESEVPVTSESEVPVTSESGDPECSVTDVTSETEKLESSGVDIAVDKPECNDVQVTSGSVNTESNIVDIAVGCDNSESNVVCSPVETPECNDVQVTTGSGNTESNVVDSAVGSRKPDPKEVRVTTEPDNSETNSEHVTTGSGNTECNEVPSTSKSGKPENNIADSGDDKDHVTTKSDNSETTREHVASASSNPECNEVPSTSESSKPENSITDSGVGSGNPDDKEHITTKSDNSETTREHVASGSGNPECNKVPSTSESGKPDNNIVDSTVGSGNPDCKDHPTTGSDNSETKSEHVTAGSGNPECKKEDCAAGSGNPHSECAIPGNSQELESSKSSKSPKPNLRVRRSSSSRVSYPTILSEDTFKEPQQQEHTHSKQTTSTATQETQAQPNSQTKSGPPKRLGLFRRLRGETNKTPVPKILIQDFSEKEERLTAKERRRRKREKERKEREEKERKKREKELEKDKEKERKKPQTRGKSFQVLSKKGADNVVSPENSDSQKTHTRRNSAPFSDGYF